MEQTKAKTAEISAGAIEKVFNFINGISASIIYEDPYDYSKGIKGAEVGYIPETVEELASELELEIIIGDISAMLAHYKKHSVFYAESHIANLEAQNKDLKSLIKDLLPMANDGYKLSVSNGCHQDFLEDDRTILSRAKQTVKEEDMDG